VARRIVTGTWIAARLICSFARPFRPKELAGIGTARVGANISTELFNDFKAPTAFFKSQGFPELLETRAC
jgi:hypothetical protein